MYQQEKSQMQYLLCHLYKTLMSMAFKFKVLYSINQNVFGVYLPPVSINRGSSIKFQKEIKYNQSTSTKDIQIIYKDLKKQV